ncbi:MAG: uroporphyrinogen-III C-methyltransferase [Planctomycetota bacterium]
MQGKVYLVGAGPGDLELITLKGYQMIGRANVILHDHLIPLELLKLAKPDAEIISVGKFGGRHTMPQDEINSLLIEKVKTNKVVVRLKGGDPYLFGRGGEEAEACFEAGVDFEVVPGVTSALAAPCYAGIPPTHRDYTSNVAIVTGHRKKDELQIEIPRAGTVIFLMGVSNMGKIIDSLLNQGWPKKTKMAAIENGARYNQRVIKGTIGNFPEVAEKAKLRPPAIFIVGKVVEMQEKLKHIGARQPPCQIQQARKYSPSPNYRLCAN